ncbi:MAG: IS4 family transposase [Gemmatimonadales bacterium]
MRALFAAVETACEGAPLTLTGLGRWLRSRAKVKHSIKRMDRLVSNSHLHRERLELYAAQSLLVLGGCRQPVIVVDWSDLSHDRQWQLLRASVAVGGRALTLYEEVHGLSKLGNPTVHRRFLACLKRVLPQGCIPIVVTDAGFEVPWFRLVEHQGWEWLGRVKNRSYLLRDGDSWWYRAEALHEGATAHAKCLGSYTLTESNPLACSVYRYKNRAKGRVRRNLDGTRSASRASTKKAKANREPWLIVTSLPAEQSLARRVINLFAKRMQIEEAFRDLKSHRFGLAFEDMRTKNPNRLGILTLIATLAHLALWLTGHAAKHLKAQYDYQANTERGRAVLSTVFLGAQVWRRGEIPIRSPAVADSIAELQALVAQGAKG